MIRNMENIPAASPDSRPNSASNGGINTPNDNDTPEHTAITKKQKAGMVQYLIDTSDLESVFMFEDIMEIITFNPR